MVHINQKITSRSLAPPLLLSTNCESPSDARVSRAVKSGTKMKSSQAPRSNSFTNMWSLWTSSRNGKTWGHLSAPWWMWTFRAVENRWGVADCRVLKHPTSKLCETYTWLTEGKRRDASKWPQNSDHMAQRRNISSDGYFSKYSHSGPLTMNL